MKAGLLKEKITILKPRVEKTQTGAQKMIYEDFYETRTHVINNSGNRENNSGEVFYSNNKTFIVRSYVPVNEHMIILYRGNKYKILSIDPNLWFGNLEIQTEKINE